MVVIPIAIANPININKSIGKYSDKKEDTDKSFYKFTIKKLQLIHLNKFSRSTINQSK